MSNQKSPNSLWITINEQKIHTLRLGEGKKLLIIFHGFAGRAEHFLELCPSLEAYFDIILVDLPFHGRSEWDKDHFRPADIRNLIFEILQMTGYQRFSLMAHSMGGFIAFKIYEKMASLVENMIMLAPGGIYRALPFNPILFNSPVRRFFRYAMSSNLVPKVMRISMKMKLLHKSFYEFINQHFATEERRKRIFNSWVSLYYFNLNLNKIEKLLQQNDTLLCFFYGTKDKITPVRYARDFAKNLPNSQIIMVEGENHFFLRKPLAEKLAEWANTYFKEKQL